MNLTAFKKYIKGLDKAALEKELILLYKQVPEIKAHYVRANMTDAQFEKVLRKHKVAIAAQFNTRKGNPRSPDNRKILSIIREFEKEARSPADVIDLLLTRVEIATDFASQYGGMPDKDYNASSNAFGKAVKLMAKHNLFEQFERRYLQIFKADNLDYWYIMDMQEALEEYKKE